MSLMDFSMYPFVFFFSNHQLGYKSLFFITPIHCSCYTSKYPSSPESLTYIAGFLHQCIYTQQHIPEDEFYFVYIQSQSLTLLLCCNKCYMEHTDHENLSWCVLSTISVYYACISLPFLKVLLLSFRIAGTQLHFRWFYI